MNQPQKTSIGLSRRYALFFVIAPVISGAVVAAVWQPWKSGPVAPVAPPATTTRPAETPTAGVSYSGEGEMVERGLLEPQVAAIKMALADYAQKQGRAALVISFSNVQHSILPAPDGDNIHLYSADIRMDGTNLRANIELPSDTSVRLRLFAAEEPSKQLYDSGAAGSTSL